ncbi:P63C domain-containing protein [Aureispira anguillae]|uniref:P63C domain-containing protein n=1 Tax=Aureispira anguillae TaxID=2864201 RepID=A0A915YD42_9BACT|nr:P63C domain-containing protein [Aureispira anguillae]BDS10831.1 P63C domain-containing protein [Aureispira anguillae]
MKEEKSMEIYHATHRGYLNIGSEEYGFVKIPCAVLEGKKRIISQTGLFAAFKRPRKGEKRQKGLPSIIGAKNLLPFVTEEVKEKCNPIHYYHTNGTHAVGYDAELIPLVCELYLKAKDANATVSSQDKMVVQANILIRSLAKVGITALIDEATGYQYDREKNELQKILSKYILEDFLKWQSRFPRKFYQEVFRLYNWKYDPFSLKRPGCLGTFTNKYVYEQLPPGILDKLKKINPPNLKGQRPRKHHQHLTQEVGLPHLDKHLLKLITVMELSEDIEDFKNNFNKIFKKVYQMSLNFDS